MNMKILTVTALTLLLAGQTAFAGPNDDGQEFLGWLDNPDNSITQVSQQPLQFDKVSIKHYNAGDTTYKAEDDVFSIHYISDK